MRLLTGDRPTGLLHLGHYVRSMFTDPNRTRPDVPGKVEGNPVFALHDAFNPNVDEVNDLKARYRAGKVSDVEVKQKLTTELNTFLDPIRDRRAALVKDVNTVDDILSAGTKRYNEEIANPTLMRVRDAMGLAQ